MDFTYKIRRVDVKNSFLGVTYSADQLPDYQRNFQTNDFDTAAVDALVKSKAGLARAYWDTYSNQPETGEVEVGDTGSGKATKIVYQDTPDYDPVTQNLVEGEEYNPDLDIRLITYTVVPASQTEISERRAIQSQQKQQSGAELARAQSLIASKVIDPATLTDEELATLAVVYELWLPGAEYAVDDIRYYDSRLWICVQPHTAQPDWAPEFVPALWTPYRDPSAGAQPWVQPTGAQDAYAIGDQVTHDNPNDFGNIWLYESTIAANTTEPGRDGTFDRYWTPVEPA